jgi:metal-responsive CopG/Arc/MetJ family transcriptional regulator
MSRATITLPNDLLAELMSMVSARSKTEAVIMAIKEEIRLKKLEKIRTMAGKMEFTATAEELRHADERLG